MKPQTPSISRGKFKMHLVLLLSASLQTLECLYGISFKLLFCPGLRQSSWNFEAKKRLKYQMEGSVDICVRGQEQMRAETPQGNFLGAVAAWNSCQFQTSELPSRRWDEPAVSVECPRSQTSCSWSRSCRAPRRTMAKGKTGGKVREIRGESKGNPGLCGAGL